jgi:hypothetical protein
VVRTDAFAGGIGLLDVLAARRLERDRDAWLET